MNVLLHFRVRELQHGAPVHTLVNASFTKHYCCCRCYYDDAYDDYDDDCRDCCD